MQNKDYQDIIFLKHHVSKVYPHMSKQDRAAQFSPFAALTGHNAAIEETGRLVDEKLELDQNQIDLLNDKLQYIKNYIHNDLDIWITYFSKDLHKNGGKYITCYSHVKKIDEYRKWLILDNDLKIEFDDIYSIRLE